MLKGSQSVRHGSLLHPSVSATLGYLSQERHRPIAHVYVAPPEAAGALTLRLGYLRLIKRSDYMKLETIDQ